MHISHGHCTSWMALFRRQSLFSKSGLTLAYNDRGIEAEGIASGSLGTTHVQGRKRMLATGVLGHHQTLTCFNHARIPPESEWQLWRQIPGRVTSRRVSVRTAARIPG